MDVETLWQLLSNKGDSDDFVMAGTEGMDDN